MFLSRRGGVYYLFFADESGRRHTRSTGARAKSEAIKYLRAFNAEETSRRRALKPLTLSAFQDSFRAYSSSIHTAKTTRSNCIALRVFTAFMGADVVMHTIAPSDCERFLASKAGEVSPYTLRYYYLALCASFERAKTWGHVLENPWHKVKKPRTPEILPSYFTREQFRALLAVIQNRDLRELVTLAALTGLRQGELIAMRWDWVDFDRRVLTVTNSEQFTTKSKRARVVPLCDEARTVLLSLNERAKDRGPVFTRKGHPMEEQWVSKGFKKAVRAAQLPDTLHFHSLRHYAEFQTMPSQHAIFSRLSLFPLVNSA